MITNIITELDNLNKCDCKNRIYTDGYDENKASN